MQILLWARSAGGAWLCWFPNARRLRQVEHDARDSGHQSGADVHHQGALPGAHHMQSEPGAGLPSRPAAQRLIAIRYAPSPLPSQAAHAAQSRQQQLGAADQQCEYLAHHPSQFSSISLSPDLTAMRRHGHRLSLRRRRLSVRTHVPANHHRRGPLLCHQYAPSTLHVQAQVSAVIRLQMLLADTLQNV